MEKSKSRLSHTTCKSRTLRGIHTFPPPLRLLTYETGHFICSQKRTFSLANDTSGLATTRPELSTELYKRFRQNPRNLSQELNRAGLQSIRKGRIWEAF